MPTRFQFDHVFRAESAAAVFEAYFDGALLLEQDRALEVVERDLLEFVDDGETVRRVSRIVPHRQLPVLLRPFISEPLHVVETAIGKRSAPGAASGSPVIEIETRFPTLRKVPTIVGRYRLTRMSDGAIQRSYEGTATAEIALIAGRIERGIVAELERALPIAASCCQAYLDRRANAARPGTLATG